MRKALFIVIGILLILAGVAVPLTTVLVVFILPPKYAATVRIDPGGPPPLDQNTEMVKIQSGAVLSQVISNLNLSAKWGEKYKEGPLPLGAAESILRRDLSVRRFRNTSLLEISVESDSPDEAVAIATQVAEVYRASPLAARNAEGNPAVQIIDQAQFNPRPVRPNKARAIAVGCGVGIILGLTGVALMAVSGRRKKPVEP